MNCNMKTNEHNCPPETTAIIKGLSNNNEKLDSMTESVDELREKLANMKRLMEERKGTNFDDISARKHRNQSSNIIDGNFLSWIFGTALAVIISVTFYAFYNLYNAVLKKLPTKHIEL